MGTGEFRRRFERKIYSSDVVYALRGRAYAGYLKNISMGGAFVITPSADSVAAGDGITISIPYTNGKQSIKRRARVMWTNDEGFAIEFF